jgi:hypothetical protein
VSQSALGNSAQNSESLECRRSTRIDRSVPLIIFGLNTRGESFVERTVSTSVNLHGCRYPSRHDYGVGSWVTLQVVGLNVEPKPAAVRAQVRSIHAAQSPRELQQVGVELESPSNVWGVTTPPQDWIPLANADSSFSQLGASILPASEPLAIGSTLSVPPEVAEPKLAEVTTFPSTAAPAYKSALKPIEVTKPKRVVITPDALIGALQIKMERVADKAVQDAVSKHVGTGVRSALQSIEAMRHASLRQIEEATPNQLSVMRNSVREEIAGEIAAHWKEHVDENRTRMEEMVQNLEARAAELRNELEKTQKFLEKMRTEFEPQVKNRVDSLLNRATTDFEATASRATDRRYERLLEITHAVTQEAMLKLDARSAEVQALIQNSLNSALGAFQRQTENHVNMTLSEAKERAVSALSTMDAEVRASWEARREAMDREVARSTERSTDQFRKGMKAFLYSCLVAAVSAVDEHSKSTLDGLVRENGNTLYDDGGKKSQDEPDILPPTDIDPLTH